MVESLPIIFVGSIFLLLSLSLVYQYIRAKFALTNGIMPNDHPKRN